MGNYRFHYHVTGNTLVELAGELHAARHRQRRLAAFVSAMGSAGTIAAGDRLKQVFPDLQDRRPGADPVPNAVQQRLRRPRHPGHRRQARHLDSQRPQHGRHHVHRRHRLQEGLAGADRPGRPRTCWSSATASRPTRLSRLATIFGISGVCNVLGAIKTAKHYRLGEHDVIVTICTDAIDRYHSVMDDMARSNTARIDEARGSWPVEGIFHGSQHRLDQRRHARIRRQWHNLKYYTWVEQQGKTVEELDAQLDPAWWIGHQELVPEIDTRLNALREAELSKI